MTVLIPLAVGLAGSYISHLVQPVQNVGKLDPLALKPLTGYGAAIPQAYGRVRINSCPMFWSLPLIQVVKNTGGKGFGSKTRTYTYYMTSAFMIGGQITGLKRVWMNGVQVFDEDSKTGAVGGQNFFARLVKYEQGQLGYIDAYNQTGGYYTDNASKTFAQLSERFLGDYTQGISSTIASVEGTNIPAYRGRSYIVTNRYPLAQFNGTSFPQVDVEVFGKLGPLPTIRGIITDIFATAGFNTDNLDLSDIPAQQYTQGLLYQRTGESYKDYIEEIQRLFFLVVREEEGKVVFLQKNRPTITLTIGLNNLGAKKDTAKSGTLFQEKVLNMREMPSEVQLSMTNLGDSFNTWTIYARNPVAKAKNPLSIQTRLSSNAAETKGIANRLISEISVQRNTYSGINLLPCWFNQLKLGDVVTLDIGTRQLAMQLTKKLLTPDFITQIEGNQYVDGKYSKIHKYHVFVKYLNTTTYYLSQEHPIAPGITYTRTSSPFVGNANNLTLVIASTPNFTNTWGVLSNNTTFIPLLGPVGDANSFALGNGKIIPIVLSSLHTNLDTTLLSTNLSNIWLGSTGLNADAGINFQIVAVVEFDGDSGDATANDIYNNSQFFNIDQVKNNTTPQLISNNTALAQQPAQGNLILLDIPLLNDTDPPFTLYAAIENVFNFSSGDVYSSTDGGNTYKKVATVSGSHTVGKLVGTLGSGVASIIDRSNSFTVFSKTVINPVTTDQFLNGENLILVGNEIIAFRDVTLLGDNQYQLSYLIRGCKGTEWAMRTHSVNEQVVLLNNLIKITANKGYINQTALFKLVPPYEGEEQVTKTTSLTYQGNSVKPYTIANVKGIPTPIIHDVTITWNRRTYQKGGLQDYVDIGFADGELEQFIIDIYTQFSYQELTIQKTYTVSSPTFFYSAAQQIADFGYTLNQLRCTITQASSNVGKGQTSPLQSIPFYNN